MLWTTFALALIMTSVFYSKYVSYVSGIGAMIVYTIVAMKLLSFIPDNIHVVRRKIQAHEIIAEDHGEHFHLFPLDGPVASDTIEEDISVTQTEKPKPVSDKEARKNEKIAGFVEAIKGRTQLEKVIVASPAESMPSVMKALYALKCIKNFNS